jgi:hypothetical protein
MRKGVRKRNVFAPLFLKVEKVEKNDKLLLYL